MSCDNVFIFMYLPTLYYTIITKRELLSLTPKKKELFQIKRRDRKDSRNITLIQQEYILFLLFLLKWFLYIYTFVL